MSGCVHIPTPLHAVPGMVSIILRSRNSITQVVGIGAERITAGRCHPDMIQLDILIQPVDKAVGNLVEKA